MSDATSTVGRAVWHEQVSDDPTQAEGFYTDLFGWGTEVFKSREVAYTMIAAGGRNHGGFAKRMEGAPPAHWLSHIHVEDVDDTVEKAKRAGGGLAAGPFAMDEVGRMAIISDPQGAYISLYCPDEAGPAAEGVFVWDELGTTDADAAQRFYGEVFGWTAVDMGDEFGGYRVFNVDEVGVAGMMTLPDDAMTPLWQPYVAVADPDATSRRAKELGASVLQEPMDVPTVGRLAVLTDPQGATFGIIAPTPAA